MKEPNSAQFHIDWLRLACLLLMVSLTMGIAGFCTRHSPLFPLVVWLMVATILGTAGISWGMIATDTPSRPTALAAFSLFLVTPGFYFYLVPIPLLPMLIIGDVPKYPGMPIRTTIGIVLILTISAVAALGAATVGIRLARWFDRWTDGLGWLAPLPLFLLMLLAYHLAVTIILVLVSFLRLYPGAGIFSRYGIS